MLENILEIRIRYAETDQMGFVYYGNYAQYLELGRVALMKQIGISYKKLEEEGVGMPVREMNIKYFKAAKYDDLIQVKTTIKERPNLKFNFIYHIYKEGVLLAEASTTLFFMDKNSQKVIKMPKDIEQIIMENFPS